VAKETLEAAGRRQARAATSAFATAARRRQQLAANFEARVAAAQAAAATAEAAAETALTKMQDLQAACDARVAALSTRLDEYILVEAAAAREGQQMALELQAACVAKETLEAAGRRQARAATSAFATAARRRQQLAANFEARVAAAQAAAATAEAAAEAALTQMQDQQAACDARVAALSTRLDEFLRDEVKEASNGLGGAEAEGELLKHNGDREELQPKVDRVALTQAELHLAAIALDDDCKEEQDVKQRAIAEPAAEAAGREGNDRVETQAVFGDGRDVDSDIEAPWDAVRRSRRQAAKAAKAAVAQKEEDDERLVKENFARVTAKLAEDERLAREAAAEGARRAEEQRLKRMGSYTDTDKRAAMLLDAAGISSSGEEFVDAMDALAALYDFLGEGSLPPQGNVAGCIDFLARGHWAKCAEVVRVVRAAERVLHGPAYTAK